jgi:hypothetical protein
MWRDYRTTRQQTYSIAKVLYYPKIFLPFPSYRGREPMIARESLIPHLND